MKENEYINKQLGYFLTGIGSIGFLIGIILKFHKNLILISNVLFFLGIFFTIGIEGYKKLFFYKKRKIGTIFFLIGFI